MIPSCLLGQFSVEIYNYIFNRSKPVMTVIQTPGTTAALRTAGAALERPWPIFSVLLMWGGGEQACGSGSVVVASRVTAAATAHGVIITSHELTWTCSSVQGRAVDRGGLSASQLIQSNRLIMMIRFNVDVLTHSIENKQVPVQSGRRINCRGNGNFVERC